MEKYKEYATERQWEAMQLFSELGNKQAVADQLGISRSTVRGMITAVKRKAAKAGLNEGSDATRHVPDGFEVIGTSTLTKTPDGEPQWVKTKQSLVDIEDKIKQACEVLCEEVNGKSNLPATTAHTTVEKDKLSLYPITDLHVGMLAWGAECGDSQDLKIIEEVCEEAVGHVVDAQPNSESAVVCFMGDYFHSDDDSNETKRSGNELDCDGRTDKAFGVGVRIAQRIIERVAAKHRYVHVIVLPGNHDEYLSMSMKYVLQAYYSNDDAIDVEITHGVFGYREFGSTLIAFHHGHTCKPQRMFEVITHDQREAWGRTRMCHVLTGHIHHQSVIDVGACKIESFRTMAAKDEWTASSGYRSLRTMYSITYDRELGECGRSQYNILPPCAS